MSELIKSLIEAQKGFEPVIKTKEGYKYFYADLHGVWEAVKDHLFANQLTIIQRFEPTEKDWAVRLVTVLCHSAGETIESTIEMAIGDPDKQDPQGMGSLATYARRYGLMAMLGICPEDDDAAGITKRKEKSEPKKPKPEPKPEKKKNPTEELREVINNFVLELELTPEVARTVTGLSGLDKLNKSELDLCYERLSEYHRYRQENGENPTEFAKEIGILEP